MWRSESETECVGLFCEKFYISRYFMVEKSFFQTFLTVLPSSIHGIFLM